MAIVSADLLRPLFQDAIEMLSLTWESFRKPDIPALDKAEGLGRGIHAREKELTAGLLAKMSETDALPFIPGHIERIGDGVEGLVRCLRSMQGEGTVFTDGGVREVNELFARAHELLQCACDLTLTGNRVLARHIEIESMRFQDLVSDFARAHEARLLEGVCSPGASSTYLAMLDHLREIVRHARRIASRVAPQPSIARGGGLAT